MWTCVFRRQGRHWARCSPRDGRVLQERPLQLVSYHLLLRHTPRRRQPVQILQAQCKLLLQVRFLPVQVSTAEITEHLAQPVFKLLHCCNSSLFWLQFNCPGCQIMWRTRRGLWSSLCRWGSTRVAELVSPSAAPCSSVAQVQSCETFRMSVHLLLRLL